MNNVLEFLNMIIKYAAGYTLMISIYGFAFYTLAKLIISIVYAAYTTLKEDLQTWRNHRES